MALDPLLRLVEAHVMAAERLHGDDTTVPVLAKGKPIPADVGFMSGMTSHSVWDRAAGSDVLLLPRPQRRASTAPFAGYAGLAQADAFDGYRQLYLPDRSPGPIVEAGCWVWRRRPFPLWPISRRTLDGMRPARER